GLSLASCRRRRVGAGRACAPDIVERGSLGYNLRRNRSSSPRALAAVLDHHREHYPGVVGGREPDKPGVRRAVRLVVLVAFLVSVVNHRISFSIVNVDIAVRCAGLSADGYLS